ncbi:MAG: hypothetical protein RRZ24_00165 [Clostridia bacterium]
MGKLHFFFCYCQFSSMPTVLTDLFPQSAVQYYDAINLVDRLPLIADGILSIAYIVRIVRYKAGHAIYLLAVFC